MKVNSTYLLSGACIAAGIVALVVRSHLASPPPPPTPVVVKAPEQMAVLVAAKALRPGDFIDTSSLRWEETQQPVSRTFNFIRGKDSLTPLLGATLREPLQEGAPLTSNVVVRPNEPGFVSAVLHKGMRAISIPTNAVASNSGLVAAGDRVDIILSLRKDEQPELLNQAQPTWSVASPIASLSVAAPLLASESIVCDLRVLALNNQTDTDIRPRQDVAEEEDGLDAAAKSRTSSTRASRLRPISYQTVTLEVTPKQAEILAVAKEVGMLHLAIRGAIPDDANKTCNRADDALLSVLLMYPRVTTLSQVTDIYKSMSGVPVGRQVKMYRGGQREIQIFPSR